MWRELYLSINASSLQLPRDKWNSTLQAQFRELFDCELVSASSSNDRFRAAISGNIYVNYGWINQLGASANHLGFPIKVRFDTAFGWPVPISKTAAAFEMMNCLRRKIHAANEIAQDVARVAALPTRHFCKFVGIWHEAGGSEGSDPIVQKAAAHSKPLTWPAVALDNGVWLSHLHICVEWLTLGDEVANSRRSWQWMPYDQLTVRALTPPQQNFKEEMLQDFLSACTDVHLTGHFPIRFLGQLQTQQPHDDHLQEQALEANAKFTSDPSKWILAQDSNWWSQ